MRTFSPYPKIPFLKVTKTRLENRQMRTNGRHRLDTVRPR